MDAREILLMQHARLHSAPVGRPPDGSLADRFLSGLADEQMRMRPGPHMNSVVWLVWHMARAERRSDIGTGMSQKSPTSARRLISLRLPTTGMP